MNQSYSADELNRELPSRCQNNVDADPRFQSLQDRCFALAEDSPARDAGRFLTKAVRGGSGKELRVADARCFYDGFGIEGERGDLVVVGKAKALARVLKADLEANTLTLDRELRWQEGDPVNLPYAGSAPDIGAFEHGDTGVLVVLPRGEPALVGPGQTVALAAMVKGAQGGVTLAWDLGDETSSSETAFRHVYRNAEDYVVRLRCTDASGAVAPFTSCWTKKRRSTPFSARHRITSMPTFPS
jgi:hypothetical protein